MKNERAKGQHYIPRAAYLEHFADKSQSRPVLWTYNIKGAEIDLESEKGIQASKLCKETYMYESPDLPVNFIEQLLERIESGYNGVLNDKILNKKSLNDDDKELVSMFISTLEARVPEMKKNILGFLSRIEKMVTPPEKQNIGGRKSATQKEIEKSKDTIFSELVRTATFVNRWRFSDFFFLFNDKYYSPTNGCFFITSDRPVTLYDFTEMNSIYGLVPISENLEVIVPLTPKVVLFINNRGFRGYGDIDYNFMREVNNRIALYSSGRIVSPHKFNTKIVDTFIKRNRQSFILKYLPKPEKNDELSK